MYRSRNKNSPLFQSTLPTRGSDNCPLAAVGYGVQFQSTLPTRGSDAAFSAAAFSDKSFNPRSPRGGATTFWDIYTLLATVSIHAPHEGERQTLLHLMAQRRLFQSTLPTRGSDSLSFAYSRTELKFQSTLPTRGSDGGKVHLYAAFPRIY